MDGHAHFYICIHDECVTYAKSKGKNRADGETLISLGDISQNDVAAWNALVKQIRAGTPHVYHDAGTRNDDYSSSADCHIL